MNGYLFSFIGPEKNMNKTGRAYTKKPVWYNFALGNCPINLATSCWLVLLLACSIRTDLCPAQETVIRIRQVQVKGNQNVPPQTILDKVRSRAGAVFSEKIVSDDARRIMAMPQIADVEWQLTPVGDMMDLTFTVRVADQIESVEFIGNKNIKTSDLAQELRNKGITARTQARSRRAP